MGHELDGGHQQVASQLAAQEQRLEELAAAAAAAGRQNGEAALVEELRANQVRIANDLARHEIAFRQDLAALAELVEPHPPRQLTIDGPVIIPADLGGRRAR